MRIIIVSSSLPRGSSEAFLIPEILEMKALGNDVLLVPMKPSGKGVHSEMASFKSSSIVKPLIDMEILFFGIVTFLSHPIRYFKIVSSIIKGSRNTRILLKNIVILPKAFWLASIAEKWNADHIHSYWISTSATLAMLSAMVSNIPWSATAYRWDIAENNLIKEKSESASFIRVADFNGTKEISQFVSYTRSCPLYTIHSGAKIPVANYDSYLNDAFNLGIEVLNQDTGEKGILVPAMFVPKKGHSFLVEAMAMLKEKGWKFRCIFVGDGPLLGDIKKELKAKGLEEYSIFTGAISHSTLLGLFNPLFCDVVVVPSIETDDGEKEGIPMSLIEAMAQGIPVVSTNTGGIPELLGNGSGQIVKQKNATELYAAIQKTFIGGEEIAKMARIARDEINSNYSAYAVVSELCELFRKSK